MPPNKFIRIYKRPSDPEISVIISTRNRSVSLSRCLEAVSRLDPSLNWELVVVDNGSTDGTADVLDRFSSTFERPLTYVYEPKKGLSNARNAGCVSAQGQILAFTDDDCYVDQNYLHALIECFKQEDVGYVTGRIMLFDPTDHPVTINESTTRKDFVPGQYLAPGEVKGANMAFRSNVLEQIGGFDPAFGSGAFFPSEDCDAAARASLRGWRGSYEPTICVHHHHGRKADDLVGLFKDYDVGRGAYHAKLLLQCRKLGLFLRGLKGIPRRFCERPVSLYWEMSGMLRYAFHFAFSR